jgi:hypothetical protein
VTSYGIRKSCERYVAYEQYAADNVEFVLSNGHVAGSAFKLDAGLSVHSGEFRSRFEFEVSHRQVQTTSSRNAFRLSRPNSFGSLIVLCAPTHDTGNLYWAALPRWRTSEMANKGVLDSTRKAVVNVAKAGAKGVKEMATDALGAAATAATGVILDKVSGARDSSRAKADEAAPPQPASAATTRSRSKPVKKRRTATRRNTKNVRASTKTHAASKAHSGTKARAVERGDRADAVRHRHRGAKSHRAAHAIALRPDLLVCRHRRLAVQPSDENALAGYCPPQRCP